jgi:hypothetical protein
MLGLLIGYPRLVGPPTTPASPPEGWASQLGAQVMAGAELIGLAKAHRRQAVTASDGDAAAVLPPGDGSGLPPKGDAPAASAVCAPAPHPSNSPALAALARCGNGIIEPGEECDGPTLGDASCRSLGFSGDCGQDGACVRPGLACLRSCRFDYAGCTTANEAALQRIVSNGNGTATDRLTGLMWEQKCSELTCPDQHQVAATLGWRSSATEWVNALNEQRFAGHDDWRLPSLEELRTLLAVVPPCTAEPCAGSAWPRHETAAAGYWSSTTFAVDTGRAWAVSFGDGEVYTAEKSGALHVRAVRRGS